MVDPEKQIEYWRAGSEECVDAATHLLERGHVGFALFFLHLALEKALKAHVCKRKRKTAPKLHRLERLLEIAGIDLSDEHEVILMRMNRFNMEGRYPDSTSVRMAKEEVDRYVLQAKEVHECLIRLL